MSLVALNWIGKKEMRSDKKLDICNVTEGIIVLN